MRWVSGLLAAGLIAAPLAVASPAQADAVVKRVKLQRLIKQDFKVKANRSVKVKCPRVTWRKGRVFYCRATDRRGKVSRVRVTLGRESTGALRWRVVA